MNAFLEDDLFNKTSSSHGDTSRDSGGAGSVFYFFFPFSRAHVYKHGVSRLRIETSSEQYNIGNRTAEAGGDANDF